MSENKKIILLNCLVLAVLPNFVIDFPILLYGKLYAATLCISVVGAFFALVRPLIRRNKIDLAKAILPFPVIIDICGVDYFTGGHTNFTVYFYGTFLIPFLIFNLKQWKYIVLSEIVYFSGFAFNNFLYLTDTYYPYGISLSLAKFINFGFSLIGALSLISLVGFLFFNNEIAEAVLEEKKREVESIFENLRHGIFVLPANLKIVPGYSSETEKIVGRQNLANVPLQDLLALSTLGVDAIATTTTALSLSIGEDAFAFEMNSHLLPRILTFKNGNIAQVFWEMVLDKNIVEKFLVVMKDITDSERIAQEAKSKDKKLDAVLRMIEFGGNRYLANLETSSRYLAEAEKRAKEISHDHSLTEDPSRLRPIFRNLHTVKGNCRVFNLTDVVNECHLAETTLETLRPEKIAAADVDLLLEQIRRAQAAVRYYKNIYNDVFSSQEHEAQNKIIAIARRHKDRSESLLNDSRQFSEFVDEVRTFLRDVELATSKNVLGILDPMIQCAKQLAKELFQSDLEIVIDNESIEFKEIYHATISDIFNHLIRNGIDHGISNRISKDKPGSMTIAVKPGQAYFKIEISDNGPGLNLAKIKASCLKRGIVVDSLSDLEIANFVFLPNLTTKDAVTEISGRGVGLDIVKVELEKLQGSIAIVGKGKENDLGYLPFHFEIRLPNTLLATSA